MPVNKNAYMRYQLLDQCFSNKYKRFNIDELMDFVSEKLGYNIVCARFARIYPPFGTTLTMPLSKP